MRSIAKHAFEGYQDGETSADSAGCAYIPAPNDPAAPSTPVLTGNSS